MLRRFRTKLSHPRANIFRPCTLGSRKETATLRKSSSRTHFSEDFDDGAIDDGRRRSLARPLKKLDPTATATMPVRRTPSPSVLSTWRSAKAVCFDVDSTLCTDESIDEIAAFLGVGERVAALTSQAMGGSTKFEDALKARLDLMRPSRSKIEEFISKHPPSLSPGIPELVKELHERGTKVFLVSGGFRAIIEPIADSLSIPRSRVFANTILYDAETGEYAGFDDGEHTSRSGGKLSAVQSIRREHQEDSAGPWPIVAVGDGATDAEAVSVDGSGADIFIGYGGVVERASVAERADWFVMSIQELRDALKGGEGGGEGKSANGTE